MTIKVEWDNEEQTIIRWTFPEEWTWDDYYSALHISRQLCGQVTYMVDVIVDMQANQSIPNHVFTHAKNAVQTSSLNVGVIVVIGVHPLLRSAYNTFKRLYDKMTRSSRRELHMVALETKAYQIIRDEQTKRQQQHSPQS